MTRGEERSRCVVNAADVAFDPPECMLCPHCGGSFTGAELNVLGTLVMMRCRECFCAFQLALEPGTVELWHDARARRRIG